MIFAGQLTEEIKFFRVEETRTATGYKQTEERFLFTCPVQRLKNKERFTENAEEIFHTISLHFRLRYRSELKDTDIAEYDGVRYRIVSLDKYPRQNEMVIIIDKIND